jgi:1-acyl-sn-glycerol-3-phosphate acyltransferase
MSSTVHVMNRLCLFVCGYYWIKVTGWDNLREARRAQALMVINHSAYFDMPALFYVVTCSAVAMSAVQNVRHPTPLALSRALAPALLRDQQRRALRAGRG